MKPTKQTKRIYYIPGILTLAIAPILFIFKTDKYISDRKEYCIHTMMIGKNDQHITKGFFQKITFQTFMLSGIPKQDSSSLILIENFARGISLSKNDSIGLKVILNKNIKYTLIYWMRV